MPCKKRSVVVATIAFQVAHMPITISKAISFGISSPSKCPAREQLFGSSAVGLSGIGESTYFHTSQSKAVRVVIYLSLAQNSNSYPGRSVIAEAFEISHCGRDMMQWAIELYIATNWSSSSCVGSSE